MGEAANVLDSAHVPERASVCDGDPRGVVDVTTSVLWYPVGVLLAVLAASAVLVFCCPGRWIG